MPYCAQAEAAQSTTSAIHRATFETGPNFLLYWCMEPILHYSCSFPNLVKAGKSAFWWLLCANSSGSDASCPSTKLGLCPVRANSPPGLSWCGAHELQQPPVLRFRQDTEPQVRSRHILCLQAKEWIYFAFNMPELGTGWKQCPAQAADPADGTCTGFTQGLQCPELDLLNRKLPRSNIPCAAHFQCHLWSQALKVAFINWC